jgi:4-amino-4-deoxy-L-arabinose transferase-like glycosyltransferase
LSHRAERRWLFFLLAIAGFFVVRLPLLPRRAFDPDEFEHAHAAWSAFRGMLLYKDFFEHHTPWYYYALRPFFNWFDVGASLESATHFLVLGRALSLALTILSVGLTVRMGRHFEDRRIGLCAGLLLVSQPIFLQKTLEMRPDVPALPFLLGGLALLLRGLEERSEARAPGLPWFVGAGLALGAAVMCTQKALFVLPGTLVGLGIWALSGGTARAISSRVLSILVFVAGVCVPAVLTWAAFAAHGGGREFITNNFLLNARWKHTATHQLVKLLATSGPALGLCLVGMSRSLVRCFRPGPLRHGDVLLICIAVGLLLGVLVVPSAHRQYFLPLLPIVCLFAADGLFFLVALVARARARLRPWLLGGALAGLAVLPVIALVDAYRESNAEQIARLRRVYETTKPTDLVMDGWAGMGVFRPHAFRYFFLHEETRAMLPRDEWDAYLDALERGAIRPRLIALDENLRALGPRFVGFVERNYASSDGFFYLARD